MLYELSVIDNQRLTIEFTKKSDITSFIRWNFYSRILHSLTPQEEDGLWKNGKRLNVEIRGWPRNPNWVRISDLILQSNQLPKGWLSENLEQYSIDLKYGIQNAISRVEENGVKYSIFQIGNHNEDWIEYKFQSASREVAALCILYDLKPHPRNNIELWLQPSDYPQISNSPHKNWPKGVTANKRYFGDPSKAVESLEKMGWPRHGSDKTSNVSKGVFLGSSQEFYQLTKKEQQIKHMRIRKDIPKKWRIAILERDNFTCLYCGRKHSKSDMNPKTGKHPLLDPDHRIPVNVKTDDSNDSNFLQNLMTLCSTCNQRKREITKKFQQNDEHDWDNEEWAYPDRIDFLERRILSLVQIYAEKESCSIDEAIAALVSNDSKL